MSKIEIKSKLQKLDDLFSTEEERQTQDLEKVVDIFLSDLMPFKNHPFKVIDNDELLEMAESIKENGILVPAIVRPLDNGKYELISGHRRKRASEVASKDTMPCIVRELTDDEAIIIMVDSNLQRETILPSERAFAYKMKLNAIKHQGKRTDLTLDQVGPKLQSTEIIAKQNNESQSQVKRYIRLTELIPEILNMVDNDVLKEKPSMALSPAVELSYLTKDEQHSLLDMMEYYECTPSHAQAIKLKEASKKGTLTIDYISETLEEDKPNQVEKIKIPMERLRKILPRNLMTPKQKEEFIVRAVEDYCKRQKQKNRDAR